MDSKAIVPGDEYALREKSIDELQRVRALEHMRADKWRVEWIEPDKGLVAFVKSKTIVCPWKERKDFLKDEAREAKLREEVAKTWPGDDHTLTRAVDEVLECTGEGLDTWHGILSTSPDKIERVLARAHIQWEDGENSYTDRHGKCHHSWNKAMELAQAFAAAEPNTVLLYIDSEENRYEIEASQPGNIYKYSMLNEYRASWAIIRQWASFDADRKRLNDEIQRLRELIDKTIWNLRSSNADPEKVSNWLSRAIKGG